MTTNTKRARTSGTRKTTAKRSRRNELTDAEVDYFNTYFPVDLRTAQTLVPHLTSDEFCYLLGRCGQAKRFPRALLQVLGRANRRRDERLNKMLDYSLGELLRDQPPSISEPFAARIRQRVDKYDGPTAYAPLVAWILEEAEFYVLSNRDNYAKSARDFLLLHSAGRDALLGGNWTW